jgi:hypothetical protein
LKFNKEVFINPVIFLIIGLFFFSCSDSNEIPEDEIVAKVGDRIITSDEFKYSYEFSLQTLRSGENPRRTYLNFMIKELLVANEGYAQGFNNHRYVASRVKNRTNNNLLEAFYLKHIHGKVNIPEEKIIDALKKSTIKFRLLIWPTPSLERAAVAYDAAVESGLGDHIEKELNKLEVKNATKKNFETDWQNYLEIKPEIFAAIKDLEIGKPSQPIPYNDGYAVIEIMKIQRDAIKSDELKMGAKRKKIQARLHNIESDRILHELMDSLLTPMQIRVSSRVATSLIKPLYEWIYDGIPKKKSIVENIKAATDTSKGYLSELKKLLPEKLYNSTKGTITVEDYFDYMNYHRSVIEQSKDPMELRNRLIAHIATMIKNKKFIEIAEQEGFLDSTNIKNDLRVWEQKWTYDIFRSHLIKDITVTDEEMQDYFKNRWRELRISNVDTTRFYKYENDVYNALLFEKHSALLEKELNDLEDRYSVWINEEVLNKIVLDESQKAKETSLIVIKNFTGEFLVPTADQQWLTY